MNILSILGDVASPYYSSSNVYYSNPGISPLSTISMFSSSISNLLSLAAAILVIIGTWKILEKAGEQGWKALIPFYNNYTLYKVFWKVKWFWISLIPAALIGIGIVALITTIIMVFVADNSFYGSGSSFVGGMMGVIISVFLLVGAGIFSFVLKVLLNNRISKAFGKTAGFTVGLVLLAPVFYMILGCGKDEYKKPEEAKETEKTKEIKEAEEVK